MVAIAKELQRRGHDIRFLAAAKLIPIIKNFGIEVIEVDNMPQLEVYADSQGRESLDREQIAGKMQAMMAHIMKIETEAAVKEKPELILSGTLSGAQAARSLEIPAIMVFLQPHGPKTLQLFSKRIPDSSKQEGEVIKNKMLNLIAAADLMIIEGMPEIDGGVSIGSLGDAVAAIKEKIRFSGPLLTDYPNLLPTREILKQAHIGSTQQTMAYITIGGGSSLIGEGFLKIVLEALRLLPDVIGVIATGIAISPDAIKAYRPPDNAIIKGFVSGTEMIKASDVTIFHGGSSTLMTCIACGTPAVVVPSMGEQEDNGAVLSQHGAGIVLDKQTLTPSGLAEAIKTIIECPSYRIQAQKLKELGEKYGGAKAAADWAEELVRGRRI